MEPASARRKAYLAILGAGASLFNNSPMSWYLNLRNELSFAGLVLRLSGTTMSVTGLRYTRTSGQSSTLLEIRSGSYIYNDDPACFHGRESRTLMRLKL